MKINAHLAINNLSFGFCSYNILVELFKRGIEVDWFAIGNNADFSSFNKATPEFLQWCQNNGNNALANYKKTNPTLRLWHCNGSHESVGADQYLFVFHECDQLTPTEVNIFNNQKVIFVSSEESKQVFEQYGVTVPVHYIPLGFDNSHFYKTNKKYYPDNVTCWQIAGKTEKRKATVETARAWLKKFGNNRDHVLHLSIFNPFFKEEDNKTILHNHIFQGQKYFNVNVLPYTKTLGELNDCYNACDIAIDMSKAEGFSLPAFNTMALGKHAVIHNASAMKGWANSENAILVDPIGKEPVYDGIFFHPNQPFNQGNIYSWREEDLMVAFDLSLERKKANKVNEAGLKLQETFTWSKTVDKILEVMKG